MTAGKASALAAGFVGALALGVAIGATMDDKWWNPSTTETAVTENAPAPAQHQRQNPRGSRVLHRRRQRQSVCGPRPRLPDR